MSCQKVCSADAAERDAHEAVTRVVKLFRQSGHKNEHAIELAARALNITPRRAWALRYLTQPVRVLRQQRDLLLHRAWAHMDREAAQLRQRADLIERQAEAERLAEAQLSLPLGGTCGEHFGPGSHSSVGGARNGGGTVLTLRSPSTARSSSD